MKNSVNGLPLDYSYTISIAFKHTIIYLANIHDTHTKHELLTMGPHESGGPNINQYP